MSGEKYALFVATLANIALHVLRKKSEFWTNFSSLEPLIWPQPFISSSKLLYSTSQTTSFFFKSISTQTLQTLSPSSLLRILQTQEQDSSGQCLCPPDTPAPAPPSWGTRSEARAALQLSPTLQPCHLVLLSASSAPFPLHRYPMLHSLFWQPNYFIHSTLPSSTAIADIELQPPPSSDPPPTYVPPPPVIPLPPVTPPPNQLMPPCSPLFSDTQPPDPGLYWCESSKGCFEDTAFQQKNCMETLFSILLWWRCVQAAVVIAGVTCGTSVCPKVLIFICVSL